MTFYAAESHSGRGMRSGLWVTCLLEAKKKKLKLLIHNVCMICFLLIQATDGSEVHDSNTMLYKEPKMVEHIDHG